MTCQPSLNHKLIVNLNAFSFSHNAAGFFNGVLDEERYVRTENRRLTSLKVWKLGWLSEILVVFVLGLALLLEYFGFRFVFYPFWEFFNVTMRVIIIPSMQMMYDMDTKTIIRGEGWYQGARHVLGIRKQAII